MAVAARQPIPSLGGVLVRYRPVLAVRLAGANHTSLVDGLLDTGADETVFEEWNAAVVGVDLRQAPERLVALAGRPQPIRCRYAPVQLRITDGMQETYEWTAMVGFVTGRLHYGLLGQAGFLQYFRADFDGETREVILTPKPSLPGCRV
jgi:Retroviral aspartyl protease